MKPIMLTALSALLVTARASTGGAQPAPTGAAGDADSTICTEAPIGYTQEITASDMQNATPDLSVLVTTWEGYLGQVAALEPGAQAEANAVQQKVTDWCSDHGF